MGVNQNSRKCNATATTVWNTENQLKLQTGARSAAAHIRQNRAHSDIGVSLLLLCEIVSSDVLHTPIRKLYDTSFPRSVYSLRVFFFRCLDNNSSTLQCQSEREKNQAQNVNDKIQF